MENLTGLVARPVSIYICICTDVNGIMVAYDWRFFP